MPEEIYPSHPVGSTMIQTSANTHTANNNETEVSDEENESSVPSRYNNNKNNNKNDNNDVFIVVLFFYVFLWEKFVVLSVALVTKSVS